MKKIKLLLIAVPLLLMSCPSDDDISVISSQLIGTWVGTDIEMSGSSSITLGDQEVVATSTGESYDVDYTITFSENPNELTSQGTYGIKITTTVLGEEEVENQDELAFIDDAMWSRVGNEITVTLDDESIVLTILELTDNTLILALTVTETDIEFEEDIKLTYTYNFTFIKQ